MTDLTLETSIEASGDRPFGRRLILTGVLVIGFFLSGLGLWLAYAPIESAVIAPGTIHVNKGGRSVQHLGGGIVSEILVQEGDEVEEGETLVLLQDTRQRSQWKQLRAQYFGALANVARIYAERAGQAAILFPIELQEQTENEDVQIAIGAQRNLFASRQQLQQERLLAHKQRLAGLNSEVEAISEQIQSGKKQIALSQSLIDYYSGSSAEPNSQSRILELKMDNARIEGDLSAMKISAARAQQLILEARLAYSSAQVNEEKQLEQELREFTAQVYDLQQRLDVAEDELRRMTISAQSAGKVKHLSVNSTGDVVGPGETLMDIVPSYDELVVEASIDASEIDQVQVGAEALVELTSVNRRRSMPIEGRVRSLSTEQMTDAVTGAAYYQAYIELDRTSIQQQGVLLQPGMSTDVMIRTAPRSPIEYLLQPVSRNFIAASAQE